MGACVSSQENCVGAQFAGSRKKNGGKRSKALRRRGGSSDTVEKIATLPVDRPFHDPIFHGSLEETWFDSFAALESDWSDEDFQSVTDDMLSLSGAEDSMENYALNLDSGAAKSSLPQGDFDFRLNSDGAVNETKHVFRDEISCLVGENARGDDTLLDNCGILPSNCLPCLASTVTSVAKRRSSSSSPPPNTRKKVAVKLSFKWKDGNPTANLLSSKELLRRPIAGSQVPFCPLGKRMPDSWSSIDPGTFKIRGVNYFKDKKKELAANFAAYYPFGVDVFLSQRKIDHIARFVELPAIKSSGKVPSILVLNVQIPLYPATIFQGETDGEGISYVLYFKLSDTFAKKIPSHFQENILRLIDNDLEKVKSFRGDTNIPFRERLKILGRIANVDDLPLSAAERKLMTAYNEKPVLSRPQHEFYSGESYFEIDLDMHRFSYISRKGFETFMDRLKLCALDFGLTIQGNKAEELPEQILCCVRLNEIDFLNYHKLECSEEPFNTCNLGDNDD